MHATVKSKEDMSVKETLYITFTPFQNWVKLWRGFDSYCIADPLNDSLRL